MVDQIPGESRGVPIAKETVESDEVTLLTHTGCVNNEDYDSARGGIMVTTDADDDGEFESEGEPGGTLTCTVERDSDYYALTANHLFNPDGIDSCDANWGDDAWQHSWGEADQHLGTVDKYREEMDYAILKLDDLKPGGDVRRARWKGDIVSHASDKRLSKLIQNDTTVEQMGYKSGGTGGELESKSVSVTHGCLDTKNEGIQASCTVAKGDSGAPVYTESTASADDICIIGLTIGTRNQVANGTTCSNDGDQKTYPSFFGSPAWHMAQELDLTFGT